MLAVGIGKSKGSELALEDKWVNSIKEADNFVYNIFQVERGGYSLVSPDEEAIEIDNFLVEQHFVGTLDDDVMYMSSKSSENCLNVSEIPCSAEYHDQEGDGILNADAKQTGKQALKYEFMLEGIEENENIHATCNLSCDCSDFLLESGSAENLLLDYSSNSESTVVKNMKSTRQIQCIDEVKSVFPYIAKTFAITKWDQTTFPQNSTNGHERHTAPQNTACHSSLGDQKWLKHELLFDQQILTGLGSVSDLMEGAFLSIENEDDMILIAGNEMSERVFSSLLSIPPSGGLLTGIDKDEVPYGVGQTSFIEVNQGTHEILEDTNDSFITTKRLRKPTRRYIEETSEIESKCSYDRFKNALLTSKERFQHARTEVNYHSGNTMGLNQNISGRLQSLGVRRRKSNKQVGVDGNPYILPLKAPSTLYVSEVQDDASDESTTPNCNKRKHHRQWTLSEVVKLVDGVSRYGVGKWTEIKRLFFSSSAHRTAVDLKDKWRNLLRASFTDSENGNLVEAQQRKQGSGSIPPSILERVRELSFVHPYPRSKKKLPPTPPRRRRNSHASE